jgi:polyisoprenoid-binding protein YceI
MSAQKTILSVVLMTFLLVLAACGGGSAPAAEAPAQEAAPAAEAEAEATEAPAEEAAAEAEPTAAPAEEAAEAEPTAAPSEEGEAEEAAGAEAAAGFQTFVIDPAQSTASFLVDETFLSGALDKLGIAAGDYDIVGSTDQIEGQLEIDAANAAVGAGQFSVNVETLATDQSRRDRWIRGDGAGFSIFPTATYVVTGVENAPDSYTEGEEVSFQMTGDMTIREVTAPLTFDVTATLQDGVLTGRAFAETLMTDWGIDPPNFANTLRAENEFAIEVNFVANAQ